MSFSTASGAAPGYCTWMKTNGTVMSGMRSTRRRLYEKSPSTQSATIIMVAKTGLLMLVRVIHMAGLLRLHLRGRPGLQSGDARRDDVHAFLEAAHHLDQP